MPIQEKYRDQVHIAQDPGQSPSSLAEWQRIKWNNFERGKFHPQQAPANYKPSADELAQWLAPQLTEKNLKLGDDIFFRVFKEEKVVEAWVRGAEGKFEKFDECPIQFFSGGLGPKKANGDYQSPEGFYTVTRDKMNRDSSWHFSFNFGYPNKYDKANGRTGDLIMMHGNQLSVGCYAMGNECIEKNFGLAEGLFRKKPTGSFQVHAFPFRMTPDNMKAHKADPETLAFWKDLKVGYDYFEDNREPPIMDVPNKRYVLSKASKMLAEAKKAVPEANKTSEPARLEASSQPRP